MKLENTEPSNSSGQKPQVVSRNQNDVREALKRAVACSNSEAFLRRVEVRMSPMDLLAWLEYHDNLQGVYWSDRRGDLRAAGLGCVSLTNLTIDAPAGGVAHAEAVLEMGDAGCTFYGGIPFDAVSVPTAEDPWKQFGRLELVLPRYEILERDTGWIAAINWRLDEDVESLIEGFPLIQSRAEEEDGERKRVEWKRFADTPSKEDWIAEIEQALRWIRGGQITKIVPARCTLFEAERAFRPFTLFRRLLRRQLNCFGFGYRPSGSKGLFFGAGPELLYRRHGRRLRSEAVAGTQKMAALGIHDPTELLRNSKDLWEHRLVVEMIEEVFGELCSHFQRSPVPQVMQLPDISHLQTRFEGELKTRISDATILQALHPTPAVSGAPNARAMELLRELEPFRREFYAAPFGRMTRESAVFAVGIRSALAQGKQLRVFAGAGIVSESKPLEEWEELESKIEPMRSLLI